MPPQKEIPKDFTTRDHTDSRSFSYRRNDTQLSFTLRVDIKQQLKDFLEILNAAAKDVAEELEKKRAD